MDSLQSVGIICLFLLVLPFGMRGFLSYWKLCWGFPLSARTKYEVKSLISMRRSAGRVYIIFEILLALALGMACLSVLCCLFAVWYSLGPYFFGVTIADVVMTEPLRVGVFLFVMTSVGFPWFIFHYVGLASVRDVHQYCKEARDCLLATAERLREQQPDGHSKLKSQKR